MGVFSAKDKAAAVSLKNDGGERQDCGEKIAHRLKQANAHRRFQNKQRQRKLKDDPSGYHAKIPALVQSGAGCGLQSAMPAP